ncbi:phage Gp37/Gp68 family protein [Cohnella sp. JJ-181]|uniref:phage Gp37/Gp68 family protein n=1 Tax=Cohnella rhizoplanae TaxID=2974897 RepID=UPI0022FF4F6A|nr:phage Gp37/Gp68 family protein [Cohnella sp. JJ-181]CAI6087204.1 hypothetical protein COHCIP112018_05389 [Cohnella sp. JJ-181]
MSDKSEWTEATWNPLRGCSKVSDGCRNCYAETVANRYSGPGMPYEGTITDGRWNGIIRLVPDALIKPVRWRRPRRIFVNSMSDLFHPEVPQAYIDKVFAVIALAPQHTFQILTKRPERMLHYLQGLEKRGAHQLLADAAEAVTGDEDAGIFVANRISAGASSKPGWPLKNVWLGVSVENQKAADVRMPLLLETPAAVRWLSCEPLLGEVDLFKAGGLQGGAVGETEFDAHGLVDWVVVGGESGHKARPMIPDWARSLRDQCQAAGVPFLFKQWGEWRQTHDLCAGQPGYIGKQWFTWDPDTSMCRVGRAAAGRELDGRIWDEYPD